MFNTLMSSADNGALEEIEEGRPFSGWWKSELCGDVLGGLWKRRPS